MKKPKNPKKLLLTLVICSVGLVLNLYVLLTLGHAEITEPHHFLMAFGGLIIFFFGGFYYYIDFEKLKEQKKIGDLHIVSHKWKLRRVHQTAPIYWIEGICFLIMSSVVTIYFFLKDFYPLVLDQWSLPLLIIFLIDVGIAIFFKIIASLDV